MKRFVGAFLGLMLSLSVLSSPPGFGTETPESPFFAKGTLTQVDATAKTFRVRIEGGLELTFKAVNGTRIFVGAEPRSFAALAVNDSVEITYDYNEDFEKVADSITAFPATTQ